MSGWPTPPRACSVCGCTETNACPGGCSWIGPNLCSACGHDPCVDPQPGDRVTVAGETREIETVTASGVIYSWPGKVAVRTMYLDAWRSWAAHASSSHVGEALQS